jgi:hypothetical protein
MIDGQPVLARSRTFIRATLSDNPDLARTNYASVLASLPEELRRAYRDGDFTVGMKDAEFQVIPTAWVLEAHGAHFELRPEGIHLVRPRGTVLPPKLVAAARARKAEIQESLEVSKCSTPKPAHLGQVFDAADHAERAAIMEADAGMPREWADTFAAISQASAPGDFTPERWQDTLDGMLRFCNEWAGRAVALGWQAGEVFSLDLVAPAARVDRRGLALSLAGGARVVGMDVDGADIEMRSGSHLRFYRRPGQ